jgi:glutamate synthase domain-containing protein 2/glutamate synthase domain-containing protein 1/glutamate synthase domain-containing protein 3
MARSFTAIDRDACGVGFVAQLGGEASHEIVERALQALVRLSHRGGVDADGRSGDGAGLLTLIPDGFIRKEGRRAGIELPAVFGLGMVFLPRRDEETAHAAIEVLAKENDLRCLGWRQVPTNPEMTGPRAGDTVPVIQQCFFVAQHPTANLEDLLFRLRKEAEAACPSGTYFCSLSSRTVVYKGLLTPAQLPAFYSDLADPEFESPFAIFHQRYSTNTQPSWSLAQPFRFVAHNGEINTISANRRWLRAREPGLRRRLGLPDRARLLEERVSDSASFDNGAEVLLRQGYSPAEAMLSMVPPAWENCPQATTELRGFLEERAPEQEPWDGPAALIFTNGRTVGAKLDRNGLRPLRYTLTSDGLLVVGSEVGIADMRGKRVVERQRLGPGEILLVNLATGEFVRPRDPVPFSPQILRTSPRPAIFLTPSDRALAMSTQEPTKVMAALGWSEDQFRLLFQPLVEQGQEAVWSMGDDAPPAALSSLHRPLWDYCKQRFAQVTNPPIDSLRESHVMSLRSFLGDAVLLDSPLLDAGQLEALRKEVGTPLAIDFTFAVADGVEGAQAALARVQRESQVVVPRKSGFVLLTDRGVDAQRTALPALLATAGAWKSMVEAGGWNIPLVIETGQVLDTHHVALLIAAGATAVFPYLALEQASILRPDGAKRYRAAVEKGLRKVIARMGISTIASYRNSQLFETIALDPDVCDVFFEDASCVLGGKGLRDLLQDCLERHATAFSPNAVAMQDNGLYRFRRNGERHATSPELVRRMHRYIKSPTSENYEAFAELGEQRQPVAIRDFLEIVTTTSVPLAEVESEASVLTRFSTQAMSLGAVSPETHRTLAIAMNRLGGRSNTGEGGEDPEIYRDSGEANNRVKQVASARFGVTAEYLVHADELEIKIAQGAKPGEGGQLPASKVSVYIARLRHAVPGMTLISPPPHHDIYSIEDLAQLIYDLRAVNPQARIGVKLVSSAGVGIIATGVAKAGASVITISGHDGGTGASPITSIKNTGLPWEVGLRDAHCALLKTGLRERVRLRVDGGFKFPRDVIVGALLGADEFGFGTAALLAIGCVMARQCHLNTCPVGIATQDEKLRARFAGKPEMVETYFRGVAAEVRESLSAMGARSIGEIVGAVHRLRPRMPEAKRYLPGLLDPVDVATQRACPADNDGTLHLELNRTVDGLDTAASRRRRFRITSADRAIGAHLSGQKLRCVEGSMVDSSDKYEFAGSAGQSFGAFLIAGLHFRLLGDANDYVGKGLSGGVIAISAGEEASLRGDVLAGNTILYGATSGELYIAGRAGERFAVRNSGALAVVEGVGQHGCEYMTAGVTVILGPAGMNLGAGMTGGLCYVRRDSIGGLGYNEQSVSIAPLEVREELWLRRVLRRHVRFTGSPQGLRLLNADFALPFLRVEPVVPPCSVTETWAAILGRFKRQAASVLNLPHSVYGDVAAVV